MFQVTDSAATALREARAAQEIPDTYGVRIFAQPDEDGDATLAVAFAAEPAPGDEVSEQGGTQIFVASELVQALADHELDIAETAEGPQLALVPQQQQQQQQP